MASSTGSLPPESTDIAKSHGPLLLDAHEDFQVPEATFQTKTALIALQVAKRGSPKNQPASQ